MKWHQLRRVGISVLPLLVWLPLSARAGAAVAGAICHASNGSAQYEFDGQIDAEPTESSAFRVASYEGEFHGTGTDLPIPAKNNFVVSIRLWSDGSEAASATTPDDINYDEPYFALAPASWPSFSNGTLVWARFTPAFDKRGVPDAHCDADTTAFTAAGYPTTTCPPAVPLCHATGPAQDDSTP
jgi:hypothetical protein